jgi:hypothetical protein
VIPARRDIFATLVIQASVSARPARYINLGVQVSVE